MEFVPLILISALNLCCVQFIVCQVGYLDYMVDCSACFSASAVGSVDSYRCAVTCERQGKQKY